MPIAATQDRAEGLEEPFTLDGLVVADLPDAPGGAGWSWQALAGPLLGMAVAFIGLYTGAFGRGRAVPPIGYAIVAAFVAMVVAIGVFVVPASARRRAGKLVASSADEWTRAVVGRIVAARPLESQATVADRWRSLLDRPDRPRAVLHAEFVKEIRCIDLRSDLLEPEAINQSRYGSLVAAGVFACLALMNGMNLRPGDWWKSVLFGSTALVFLVRVPRVRDRIPMLRDTGRDLVAGPGWLRDRRDRRWTVADSTAFLFRSHKGRGTLGVIVRFVGPAGIRDVSFENARNPDFVLLWERWMHPKPRLDLEA